MYIKLFRLNRPVNSARRWFLAHSTAIATSALVWPGVRLAHAIAAPDNPKAAEFAASFARVTVGHSVIDSEQIGLTIPAIAEDGAVVPVALHSDLADIEAFYLFADKNPTPLIAVFALTPLLEAHINARVKLAESCNVVLLARRDNQFLRCSRWVNVMRGGCGTG